MKHSRLTSGEAEETSPSWELPFISTNIYSSYCWWFRTPAITSWGKGSLSTISKQGFVHPRWLLQDFWTINSTFLMNIMHSWAKKKEDDRPSFLGHSKSENPQFQRPNSDLFLFLKGDVQEMRQNQQWTESWYNHPKWRMETWRFPFRLMKKTGQVTERFHHNPRGNCWLCG